MPKKRSVMAWDEAIRTVLKNNRRVLKYTEIADIIVNEGLRKSDEIGATPANTVNATLRSDKLKDEVVCVRRGEYLLKEYFDNDPSLAIAPANTPEDEEENQMEDALITAFGRFWDRTLWEKTNKKALYGVTDAKKKVPGVDFTQHPGIYLLHKGYQVIYVGQALHLVDRLDAHTTDDKRNRWDSFSWFSLESFDNESENTCSVKRIGIPALLDTLEALLIETLGPERNRKIGDGFNGKEFEQISETDYLRRYKLSKKP